MIADKSVSIHATLAEMLGTGMVVLIGTAAVQLSTEATEAQAAVAQAAFADRATLPSPKLMRMMVCPWIVHEL